MAANKPGGFPGPGGPGGSIQAISGTSMDESDPPAEFVAGSLALLRGPSISEAAMMALDQAIVPGPDRIAIRRPCTP